jgi:hypothetical protein
MGQLIQNPEAFPNDPGWHGVQRSAPSIEVVPRAQVVQVVDRAAENLPAEQILQPEKEGLPIRLL